MNKMKFIANAKINLRLNVLGKNEFNYHNLSMVNAKISLADEIEVHEALENKVVYSLEHLNYLENDLCLNVLNEITNKYNIDKKYYIYIKKNIPLGAGLGGGSSDVACIINLMNDLHKLNLTNNEKINIGLKYGADVPYCLFDSVSLVEGIGEKVTPLNINFKQRIIVVYPNIFVSTKDVFKNVLDYSNNTPADEIEKMFKEKNFSQLLYNDLEKPSFNLQPKLKEIKQKLLSVGNTIMSGSGSSFLVLIDNNEQLNNILEMFPNYLVYDTYIL